MEPMKMTDPGFKIPLATMAEPIVAEKTPMVSEKAPIIAEKTPMVSDKASNVAEKTPIVAEKTSIVAEKTPMVTEKTPMVSDKTPMVAEKTPKTALSIAEPSLNYDLPTWATICDQPFSLEMIKEGVVVSRIEMNNLGKSFLLIGRLASCDTHLEHVSISRHHCLLQHGDGPSGNGWYIYDLGSTHGSFRNKERIPSRQYLRLHSGHVLKFGGSTRVFVLNGPEEEPSMEKGDRKPEEEPLMEEKKRHKNLSEDEMNQMEKKPIVKEMKKSEEKKDDGINWGMGMYGMGIQ